MGLLIFSKEGDVVYNIRDVNFHATQADFNALMKERLTHEEVMILDDVPLEGERALDDYRYELVDNIESISLLDYVVECKSFVHDVIGEFD